LASSVKDLGSQLTSEMERLLADSGIRHIYSYGWQSEDEIDPSFFGHAVWQTEPPINHAFELDSDTLPSGGFSERKKELMVLGIDFEGTMIAGRSAVGDILFYSESSAEMLPTMDLNIERSLLHALMDLNIASDRIKDFFIWAFWEMSPKDFCKKKDIANASWYTAPFREASKTLLHELDQRSIDLIKNLESTSNVIYELRRERNIVVHELTSSIAQHEKRFLEGKLKNIHNSNDSELTFEEIRRNQKLVTDTAHRLHHSRVELVRGFYRTLIRMSSDIFELEYHLR